MNDIPAFPSPSLSQDAGTGATTVHQSEPGMTLRDYFAARAPEQFDSWVWSESMPVMLQTPSIADYELSEIDQIVARDWVLHRISTLPEQNADRVRVALEHLRKDSEFVARMNGRAEADYYLRRACAWNYAWADAMIAARNEVKQPGEKNAE